MPQSLLKTERAQPLLGTTVAIRVSGLSEPNAHRAISNAFAEISRIHRLMSFHEADSDVSRLNRNACERTVTIDPSTFEVLSEAQQLSKASQGCFDVTVASRLVDCGLLPVPSGSRSPDMAATWRDIELGEGCAVRFRRPLWIDFGGIAKGYAVDRAVQILESEGVEQACVNAGGDLRVHGTGPERVFLRPEVLESDAMPVLDVENAAVASSSGYVQRQVHNGEVFGPHIDGRTRRTVSTDLFASVVAERCMIADALTKVVLAQAEHAVPLLLRNAASAHLYDPRHGWRHFVPE